MQDIPTLAGEYFKTRVAKLAPLFDRGVVFEVVEGFAHQVGELEAVVDEGVQVVSLGGIETCAFQGQGLAVDIPSGIALQGDAVAPLGDSDAFF
jgi:hypothetical protein